VGVVAVKLVMIAGILLAVGFQNRMLKKIPPADYARDNLRMLLEKKMNF
jgi:hypothetical protein